MEIQPKVDLVTTEPTPLAVETAEGHAGQVHEPRRLLALDGIRGLAVLLVLQFHWAEGLTRMNPVESTSYFLLRAGWLGVDLFFVLSGFLITGILSDSKNGFHYFRNFYMRRVLRIFPAYYGFLIVAEFVVPGLLRLAHHKPIWQTSGYGWYWLYISNIGAALGHQDAEGFGHFWSLAVEEQFYFFWPLLVYFLSRRAAKRASVACIFAALTLRTCMVLIGHSHPAAAVLMPCRLDALAIGAWLALAQREGMFTAALLRTARRVFWVCALFLAAVYILSGGRIDIDNPVMQSVGYTIADTLFGCLLLLALQAEWFGFLKGAFFRVFGKYSYMIYIIHVPLHASLWKIYSSFPLVNRLPTQFLRLIPFLFFATFVCLALAMVSWKYYESQFLKLKKRFPENRQKVRFKPGNSTNSIARGLRAGVRRRA